MQLKANDLTHVDLHRKAAAVVFSNTETGMKAVIALAFVDSMQVEDDGMTIVTIGGAEYTVSASFWDDVSTWWIDYLSGGLGDDEAGA
jgi:hypothetical protein